MLKKHTKLAIIMCLIMALCSTVCLATEGEPVVTSEDSIITENVEDNSTTDDATDIADDTETNETVEPELIESDLYLAGDDITVSNYVDGNVYVMAENLTVSGKVGGDLFVLANTVTLTEECYTYGNMYVCADEVLIDGIVCDLYAFCNNLTISKTGIVLRDARTATGNISLNGSIGRNTLINTDTMSMADTAHVYGNLNYSSKEAIQVPSGTVDGSIEFSELSASSASVTDVITSYALSFAYTLVYTLVVFGLILLLAPKFKNKLHEITNTKWLPALGIGALVSLLLPIIAVLLVFTIIGTPLSFAVAGLYLLILSITFALTAIALSKILGDKVKVLSKFNNVLALVLVTLILWGLTQIPFYIGMVVKLLTVVFGFGIFTLSVFKKEE